MNTLEQSKAELIARIQGINVPSVPARMSGDDLRAAADYLRELANAIDKHVKALGGEVANATTGFDPRYFNGAVFGALDGFALFELTSHADNVDEDDRAEAVERNGSRRAA